MYIDIHVLQCPQIISNSAIIKFLHCILLNSLFGFYMEGCLNNSLQTTAFLTRLSIKHSQHKDRRSAALSAADSTEKYLCNISLFTQHTFQITKASGQRTHLQSVFCHLKSDPKSVGGALCLHRGCLAQWG